MDELSPEQYGEIDVSLKVYVQKCSACGALNYTDNPSNPVKVCYNCHKTRIAAIVPVEYVDTDSSEQEDEADSNSDRYGYYCPDKLVWEKTGYFNPNSEQSEAA
ncbi:MAG: hypothetical protein PUB97_06960 [Ruminococcus sp.]|nr:hypothetical protein [Ruminococcus sp.]